MALVEGREGVLAAGGYLLDEGGIVRGGCALRRRGIMLRGGDAAHVRGHRVIRMDASALSAGSLTGVIRSGRGGGS